MKMFYDIAKKQKKPMAQNGLIKLNQFYSIISINSIIDTYSNLFL